MVIVISGPLPALRPIKNLPNKNFIAPNDAPLKFMGSPWEQFFDTTATSQDMDENDLFGKRLPKKAQLLKFIILFLLYKV